MTKDIDALVFDVFGTVVDWRGSIIAEGETIWKVRGVDIDWEQFADAWRAGYQPAMDKIRTGKSEWATIDVLHRQILDDLLVKFDIQNLNSDQIGELNRVWHRLRPWDDAAEGLERLRQNYITATLSNGNVSLLVNLSKNGNLRWDCILSSELARHYKPDLVTYQTACDLLDIVPERVMMVAAHTGDLLASQKIGMKTAFVRRPLEYGANGTPDEPDASFDIVASDFLDLDTQLRAR